MAAGPVDWQVRWNTQPRRTRNSFLWHALPNRELADLVELHGLQLRIRNEMALPTRHKTDLESVLRVRSFADSNPELALLVTDRSVYAERIAEVGVAAFVKGPRDAYSWLN